MTRASLPWHASHASRRCSRIGAEDATFQDAAQHPAPPPEFLPQPRPDSLHLIAGRAYHGDFQARFAKTELLPNVQAVHIQSIGCDVFSQQAGPQLYGFESFAI